VFAQGWTIGIIGVVITKLQISNSILTLWMLFVHSKLPTHMNHIHILSHKFVASHEILLRMWRARGESGLDLNSNHNVLDICHVAHVDQHIITTLANHTMITNQPPPNGFATTTNKQLHYCMLKFPMTVLIHFGYEHF
jgi:hypothetical protein